LRTLHSRHYHAFLVRSLTIILDVPDLHKLPNVSLAELLLAVVDNATEPTKILNLQNVFTYSAQATALES
jgi:hypothetical protein